MRTDARKLSLALAAALLMGGCRSRHYYRPAPPVLSGSWTIIWSANPGPLTIEGCEQRYTQFNLRERGKEVSVESYDVQPGAAYDSLRAWSGSVDAFGRLRAHGGQAGQRDKGGEELDLTWEPVSGHWVGTLGEKPLRLAPLDRRYPLEPCDEEKG